ncbi:MAG: hypothetical protein H8D95_00520 [Candidatus Endolissoclinum sp.]|nr:hypothetical protein [Candidatus Endolissoclinum sp.]
MKIDETKERGYKMLAECIRSDQLSARQVHEEFEADPEFKAWYLKTYPQNEMYKIERT